jgi:hypothetical protein
MPNNEQFQALLSRLNKQQGINPSSQDRGSLDELFSEIRGKRPLQDAHKPRKQTGGLKLPKRSGTDYVIEKVYAALNAGEMQGIPPEQQFIRTKAQPKGDISTAYGPLQITTTLAKDYAERKPKLFSKQELNFLNKMVAQGDKFVKADKGIIRDKKYRYGGQGDLTTPQDKRLYQKVAKKMLADVHGKHNGDIEKIWKEWRFGSSLKGNDPEYRKRVLTAWNQK